MKVDLEQKLEGFDGPIKNFIDPRKRNEDITLKDVILHALKTEKIMNESMNGYKIVNEKTDDDKFMDYELGMKVKNVKEIDLKPKEITRILTLAKFMETEIYGSIHKILNK